MDKFKSAIKTGIFYLIGVITVLCTFGVIGIMLFQGIPEINSEILFMLLGVMAAKFGDVISYFYGSSSSSSDKTKIMQNMINDNGKEK